MTVKELKNILDACNDDAKIIIQGIAKWDSDGCCVDDIRDSQIFQSTDGTEVIFDPTYGDEND